jgi:hypothetical protein
MTTKIQKRAFLSTLMALTFGTVIGTAVNAGETSFTDFILYGAIDDYGEGYGEAMAGYVGAPHPSYNTGGYQIDILLDGAYHDYDTTEQVEFAAFEPMPVERPVERETPWELLGQD